MVDATKPTVNWSRICYLFSIKPIQLSQHYLAVIGTEMVCCPFMKFKKSESDFQVRSDLK